MSEIKAGWLIEQLQKHNPDMEVKLLLRAIPDEDGFEEEFMFESDLFGQVTGPDKNYLYISAVVPGINDLYEYGEEHQW
jgi:uncharacterized protein (DUF2225 family)